MIQSLVLAESTSQKNLLLKMSAITQNAIYKLEMVGKGENVTPNFVADEMAKIDQILDELVELKYLQIKTISVESFAELDADSMRSLQEDVRKAVAILAEEYGMYSAQEMMGVGIKMKSITFKKDDEFIMVIRCPEKFMPEIYSLLSKYDKSRQ